MPTGFLPIREDPEKGVMISGLSLHKVCNMNFVALIPFVPI